MLGIAAAKPTAAEGAATGPGAEVTMVGATAKAATVEASAPEPASTKASTSEPPTKTATRISRCRHGRQNGTAEQAQAPASRLLN